jgi:adenylate cyclase
LDILCVLASANGAVVTKDELLARVWHGVVVEEGNIHVHVSALRKLLDDEGSGSSGLVTVPGRGYRLSGIGNLQNGSGLTQGRPRLDEPSIVVLRFSNLTGHPEQEHFVDGIVEEITTALGRVRSLSLVKNFAFASKGRAIDVQRVARSLGIRYIVEGSVRGADHRVRVIARLIETETGTHLWADRFDARLGNVLDIQEEIASTIAGAIDTVVLSAESRRAMVRPITDLSAYELYLRARALYISPAKQTAQALSLLERAIERDPQCGPALGLAASCCAITCFDGWSSDVEEDRRKGVDFAQRALRFAANDPSVFANVALALGDLGEYPRDSIALVDRALSLNPNSARAWYISAALNIQIGETETAIAHVERSLRLSPGARAGSTHAVLGMAHFLAQRFEDAARELRTSILVEPNFALPHRFLASCYIHLGQHEAAQGRISQLRALTPIITPKLLQLRRQEDRELFLSGLRIAAGESA